MTINKTLFVLSLKYSILRRIAVKKYPAECKIGLARCLASVANTVLTVLLLVLLQLLLLKVKGASTWWQLV
jgi:hypothetical protein